MKKKHITLLAITSCALVAVTGFVLASNGVSGFSLFGKVNAGASYDLVYDKDHVVTDGVIKSVNGNNIWTKANDGCSFTNNGLEFSQFGYIQNLSSLNGIGSVQVNVTSGTYVVSHYYTEPSDLKTVEYYDGTISASTTFSYAENQPSHFRVQCVSDGGTLQSIRVNYSCVASSGDPITETASEGLETLGLASNFKKGSVSYVTDTLCQSEYSVSQKALRLSNLVKNETVKLADFDKARENGVTFDDEDYFILDVKSTNTNVGSKANAFMLTFDIDGVSLGWKDPSGFIAIPDQTGWYRYFFNLKDVDVKFENIHWIGFIPTSSEAPNEIYYIDNIHLGMKPTRADNPNTNTDYLATNKFTITQDSVLAFDFKVAKLNNRFSFKLGNWNQYFGFDGLYADGRRTDNGEYYAGTYAVPLSNGWYRMYVDVDKMNRVNGGWHTWTFGGGNDDIKLLMVGATAGDAVAYVTEAVLISNQMSWVMRENTTYEHYFDATVADLGEMYFDFKVVSRESNAGFSFFLSDNWDTYFGYFQIMKNGTFVKAYDGMSISSLGSGFHRVTMDFTKLTQTSSKGAPTKLSFLRTNGWQTGCFLMSDLKTDVVPEDLLAGENVSAAAYKDKFDHYDSNYGVEEVPTMSISKETGIKPEGAEMSWKVEESGLANEEWRWVIFDLGETSYFKSVTNLSIKVVNAQPWALVRFFDENNYAVSEAQGFDFSGSDFASLNISATEISRARKFGVCLHFFASTDNIAYISKLNVSKDAGFQGSYLGNQIDYLFQFPQLDVGSNGHKIEMTFRNVVKQGDDISFYVIQSKDDAKPWGTLNSNDAKDSIHAFGKICIEPNHTLYEWGGTEYTTGITATVEDNTNKICTIVLDLDQMRRGKSNCAVPESVGYVWFPAGGMLADAGSFSYSIIA